MKLFLIALVLLEATRLVEPTPLYPKLRALINYGDALRSRGMDWEAKEAFEYARIIADVSEPSVATERATLGALSNLGAIAIDWEQYDKASAYLVEGWQRFPGHPVLGINLAKLSLIRAVEIRNAESAMPDWARPHGDQREAEKAIAILDSAIHDGMKRWPQFEYPGVLHWQKAEAYRFLGDCMRAWPEYQQAAALDPDLTEIPHC